MERRLIRTRALISFSFALALPLATMLPAHGQEAGNALAEKYCSRCHAIDSTGDSPFKDAPPFREIVGRYPVETLGEAFAEGITVGHPAMPEFEFTPEEIEELLTYLGSLNK